MRLFITLIMTAIMSFAALSTAQAEEADLTHLLGKMESNLWESTAAVFFHIADHARDDQRIALSDYNDDVETIERIISSLEKMKLSDDEASLLTDIKKTWGAVRTKGDALIEADIEKGKSDSKMHDYWLGVEELDNKIDALIEKVAGPH